MNAAPSTGRPLPAALTRGCPHKLPEGLVMPEGWAIGADGAVLRPDNDTERPARVATSGPLLALARWREASTGEHLVTLACCDAAGWKVADVPEADARNSRALVKHAGRLPVFTSIGAPLVVAWLADFLAVNHLPVGAVLDAFGWHDTPAGPVFALTDGRVVPERPAAPARNVVSAFPDGTATAGTFTAWRDRVWVPARTHGPLALAIYAATAPAVLRWIPEARGFALHFGGTRGSGKSTVLAAALSVWGPAVADAGLWGSWRGTPKGLAARLVELRDLPAVLDDSQELRRPRHGEQRTPEALTYLVHNGREDTRADVTGKARDPRTVRTVLLSTGEGPLLADATGAGAHVRALDVPAPFLVGDRSEANAATADAIREAVVYHHGHVGPTLVARLADDADLRGELPRRWRKHRDAWRDRLGKHGPDAARLSAVLALLEVVAELLERIGLDVRPEALSTAEVAAVAAGASADVPLAAWLALHDWTAQHSERIVTGNDRPAGPEVWGWRPDGCDGRLYLGLSKVREHLRHKGHEAQAVLDDWNKRGFTEGTAREGVRLALPDGGRPRCIRPTPEGLAAWRGGEP